MVTILVKGLERREERRSGTCKVFSREVRGMLYADDAGIVSQSSGSLVNTAKVRYCGLVLKMCSASGLSEAKKGQTLTVPARK